MRSQSNSLHLEMFKASHLDFPSAFLDFVVQWAYNSTLVFLSAQVVRDPVTNVTLGVALGTSTTVTLTTLLASIRPQHAGLMYVFEAESGRLISSSDMTGLYNSTFVSEDSDSSLVALLESKART